MGDIKFPKQVTIGAFKIKLILIDPDIATEVGEMQGCYLQKPPAKIVLDETIIKAGGADAVNLVLHELGHAAYYQYMLEGKDEETVVNSIANFYTELFFRKGNKLKDWILNEIKR